MMMPEPRLQISWEFDYCTFMDLHFFRVLDLWGEKFQGSSSHGQQILKIFLKGERSF